MSRPEPARSADDAGGDARTASAEFASSLIGWAGTCSALSDVAVWSKAATILADDISAMVAASEEPQVRRMQERAASLAGEATIFCPLVSSRSSAAAAAAANGLAATWCELDEGARSVPCHAGAYVLPVLMAESERLDLSTRDVLSRLAIAYEVVVRVARAFQFPVMRIHPHAVFASLGGSVAASLARGHGPELLMRSASAGVTMAFGGPFGHALEGALVRNAWTSASAGIGILSADLAEAGIGGLPTSFYDTLSGSLGAVAGPFSLEGLGHEFAVTDGYHKVYACCQYAHSAVEASIALKSRLLALDLDVTQIASIAVETHPRGETLTTVEPPTSLSAKFSMPHAAAAAAVFGEGGRIAFDEASLRHTEVARLRRAVTIRAHPSIGAWPEDRPARVTWYLRDGRQFAEECASAAGGGDRPFSREDMRAKFADLTADAFPAMAMLFAAMIDGDRMTLDAPWRDTVDAMTGRR